MGAHSPRTVVLDAGPLIAFERGDGRMRALVRAAIESDTAGLVVPAGVLAQVWRDGARQARLAALLGSPAVRVDAMDEATAKASGALCGRSRTADVIDASVVIAARLHDAVVVTDDVDDFRRIAGSVDVIGLEASR
jgi:predicted nucleic acid-binding protein